MAAGLPVVAADSGGLGELVASEGRYPAGDRAALAARARALYRDAAAGERALASIRKLAAPEALGPRLGRIYDDAAARAASQAMPQAERRLRT